MPLWLALHFPLLPVETWTPATDDDALPLAIVEQGRVCRASAAAIALGVQTGMTAATARAHGDSIVLRERRREVEDALLARLAQDALAFTPQVCRDDTPIADAPALLLEIGGCLRLNGGLAPLLSRIDTHFASRGVTAQRAPAHTPGAARLLAAHGIDTTAILDTAALAVMHRDHATTPVARARDAATAAIRRALAALPVDGLGLDNRTEENLMQMGLATFGDIDALPRAALGRRFGQGFSLWLDRVTGALPDPRRAVQEDTFYVRELNFLDGVTHVDGLAFPMQRLLGDFAQFLRRRQFATQHLVWRFTHVDHSTQDIAINTARPEISPARLMALTRARLESVRLPAPVETLRLACRRFEPLANAGAPASLFVEDGAQARREEDIAGLIDRLRARLGDARCRQLVPVDDWRPEAAASFVAGNGISRAKLPLLDARHARRPLWLLPEPARILRDGTRLRWRGELRLLDGPERLETGWWSTPLYRDYFVAEDKDGALFWVFHERVRDEWFVHGVFG